MLKLLTVIVFVWLLFTTIGLTFKLAWSVAKIISSILMALALPLLIAGLLFAGGIVLIVPIVMVCIAAGITKACMIRYN